MLVLQSQIPVFNLPHSCEDEMKDWADKLEIDANFTDIKTLTLVSIAISLKRIADKLELSQKQPIIMTAEEALIYEAGKLCRATNEKP